MYSAQFFGRGQWCTEADDLWVGRNTSWSRRDGDVLDYIGLLTHVSIGSTERYIQHSGIVKYMTGKYRVYKYVGRKVRRATRLYQLPGLALCQTESNLKDAIHESVHRLSLTERKKMRGRNCIRRLNIQLQSFSPQTTLIRETLMSTLTKCDHFRIS